MWYMSQGDEAVVKEMLIGARRVLVHAIDENRRRYVKYSILQCVLFTWWSATA